MRLFALRCPPFADLLGAPWVEGSSDLAKSGGLDCTGTCATLFRRAGIDVAAMQLHDPLTLEGDDWCEIGGFKYAQPLDVVIHEAESCELGLHAYAVTEGGWGGRALSADRKRGVYQADLAALPRSSRIFRYVGEVE